MTQRKIQYNTAIWNGIFIITVHRLGHRLGRYKTMKQKFKVVHIEKNIPLHKAKKKANLQKQSKVKDFFLLGAFVV